MTKRTDRRLRSWATIPSLLGLASLAWLLATSAAAHEPVSLEERIVAVSEAVTPSVVHISAVVRVNDRRNVVTGSGLIVSSDGLVVTNHHVVDKAVKVEVTVPGRKRRYPAEIVGTDPQTDLAVLRIEVDTPLPAATFGKVADVRVGQWVLAIGNPYGLDGTVSLGIVSAKGRNLEVPGLLNDFIQTDAMIDRGSSGGPLVDLEGRVIGLNSRGQGRGIGFTIPADTVLQVMAELENGGVERGWLGTSIQAVSRELASYLGFPDATGVIVNGITEDSPAARADLRPGDLITTFGDQDVDAEKDEDLGIFQRQVASTSPGTKVSLRLLREGRFRDVPVTIGTQPKVEPEEEETDLGFHVQEITVGLYRNERLPVREGVFVAFVAPGSPAARAGLFIGDVVVDIDGHEIENLKDFRRAVARAEDQRRVLLRARRGKDLRFLLLDRGAPSSHSGDATASGDATSE